MPYTHCAHSSTGLCESPKECAEFRQCLNDQPPVLAASGSFEGSGAAMPASEAPAATGVVCLADDSLCTARPCVANGYGCGLAPKVLCAVDEKLCSESDCIAAGGCHYQPAVNPKDEAGSKKIALGLLPAAGKIEGAKACANGAHKYGPYNWRDIPITYTVYLDAIERHLLALRDGEDCSEDSGVHHLGHIIAGASIALDALHTGTLKDDRPKVPGCASKLLKNVV